jgi:hypothetical protein
MISLNDKAKSRVPPAIIKSAMVMPRRLRTALPLARKIRATAVAVITDCKII